ncbi:hypothetical protein V8C86DRAFT_3114256 [Haematococcus lacustris]
MSDPVMLGVLTEEGVTSLAKGRNGAHPDPAKPGLKTARAAADGQGHGAVHPLAHLNEEWLGVDLGKTNMATVAHEERSADGSVVSVWQRTLTAGQYHSDSGITRQTQATKIWLAKVKTQLTAQSQVSSKPSSLASYRRFTHTVLATYDAMWAEVNKQAKKRWPDRIPALAYGAAGFKGSGTIGCRGVPFRTCRVSSADNTPDETLLDTPPESFR